MSVSLNWMFQWGRFTCIAGSDEQLAFLKKLLLLFLPLFLTWTHRTLILSTFNSSYLGTYS